MLPVIVRCGTDGTAWDKGECFLADDPNSSEEREVQMVGGLGQGGLLCKSGGLP